ncbi:MAG: SpoIID/LytB domain-containing protein [Acidobacteria bacterium]|nr:SpoIID/LytB domain-containing protein [Acidobacteriota bacterium]
MLASWLAGCSARTPEAVWTPRTPDDHAGPMLRVETGGRGSHIVTSVALDDYVRDVVVGEMPVAARDQPLALAVYSAQAIVARTYALASRRRHLADGFDLCATTHCQVFVANQWRRSRWAVQVDEAVRRTRGLVLADGRGPIEAVFHAHCGGHTSTAREVWRSPGAPYLQGVGDPYCVREHAATWSLTVSLEAVRVALNQRPRTTVGERLDAVQVLRRDDGGRVVEVVISGSLAPVVTGEDFRLAILAAAGASSLRSARFNVRRDGDRLHFSGTGAGHGVGLCQVGLLGRVRAGQPPEDALLAYYTGARVTSLSGWSSESGVPVTSAARARGRVVSTP